MLQPFDVKIGQLIFVISAYEQIPVGYISEFGKNMVGGIIELIDFHSYQSVHLKVHGGQIQIARKLIFSVIEIFIILPIQLNGFGRGHAVIYVDNGSKRHRLAVYIGRAVHLHISARKNVLQAVGVGLGKELQIGVELSYRSCAPAWKI